MRDNSNVVTLQKHAGGRPMVYDKEFIESEAEALLDWLKLPTSIYFKSFALERGYSPKRMFEWAKENEKFSDSMDIVREWQENRVAIGAMTNEFNGNFSKFFMANVCNWKEKSETTLQGSVANPLAFILNPEEARFNKELIHDEQQSVYDRGIEFSPREVEKPLLEDKQPLQYSDERGD